MESGWNLGEKEGTNLIDTHEHTKEGKPSCFHGVYYN